MFLPRIKFKTAEHYAVCARAGLLRCGQWVEFEGIKARFGRASDYHVMTFYWSTSVKGDGAKRFSRAVQG